MSVFYFSLGLFIGFSAGFIAWVRIGRYVGKKVAAEEIAEYENKIHVGTGSKSIRLVKNDKEKW